MLLTFLYSSYLLMIMGSRGWSCRPPSFTSFISPICHHTLISQYLVEPKANDLAKEMVL